jgi:hypothetical protein
MDGLSNRQLTHEEELGKLREDEERYENEESLREWKERNPYTHDE